jgi:hypothetical protein
MNSSVFYKDVVCVITNEGKSLFVKQSNGIKFAKVGAVLFSDKNKSIKNAYVLDGDKHLLLKNISLKQLKNYTTLVYKNITYTQEGNVFIPENMTDYNNALSNPENLLPIQLAYGKKEIGIDEDEEPIYQKFMSYDLVLKTNTLSVQRTSDMNFDGFAILGLPFKPLDIEQNLPIIVDQDYCTLALVYFPKDTEKLQVLYNQPSTVAMNYEIHVMMDNPILLDGLSYTTTKGLEPKNPKRFLYGIHLTNDGLHNKG